MGCDGGTIPRRDELVRVKKKPEAKDKDSELIFQWRYCAITQQVLQNPIVMCGLGKLYNKISLLEYLLSDESMPQSARHIKGLKDIKDLNLTPNPAFKDDDKNHGESDNRTAPYICPVIGLEMSGKFRFVALWSCGCVFSERALKEIATKNCHKCQKPFSDDDVVILNGNEEDLAIMKQRMELRQQKLKNKREKKTVTVNTSAASTSGKIIFSKANTEVEKTVSVDTSAASTSVRVTSSKPNTELEKTVSVAAAGSTSVRIISPIPNTEASFGAPVKSEPLNPSKPSKSSLVIGSKRSGSLKESAHDAKKMKPTYSVAKDPQVSDVYKSIFTSHASEKQQNRAHWVTYNPFYN